MALLFIEREYIYSYEILKFQKWLASKFLAYKVWFHIFTEVHREVGIVVGQKGYTSLNEFKQIQSSLAICRRACIH